MNTFEELNVREEILRALAEKNITTPTPVQSEVIPVLLSGRDCVAQAPTGSGKTFAFGIPILETIDLEDKNVQAVIMCPTRELAMQTEAELRALAKYCEGIRILAIYGGQSFDRQLGGLKKKPQIVVGTPGRIIDHIERRSLRIKGAKILVLDEADEMLDMGFRPDIDKILEAMPEERRTLLFSATISPEIAEISKSYQTDPVSVTTGCMTGEAPEIKQYVLRVKHTEKVKAFDYVMKKEGLTYVLVFTNTIKMVDTLVNSFTKLGYVAEGLHGDLRQSQRDKVMRAFRSQAVQVLIATDVAARGIDVSNIQAIFNYDVPLDNDFYVHRIGRTARAEKQGVSYTFTTTRDNSRIKEIEKVTKTKMEEYYIEGISDDKLSGKVPDTTRIFVNLGTKDNLTPDKMRDIICGNTSLKPADVKSVDIMELFSFIEVTAALAEQVVLLTNLKYMRRKVVFQLATERGERAAKRTDVKQDGEVRGKPYRDKAYSEKKEYAPREKSNGEKREYAPREKTYGEKKEYKPRTKQNDGYKKEYVPKDKPFSVQPSVETAPETAVKYKTHGENRPHAPKAPRNGYKTDVKRNAADRPYKGRADGYKPDVKKDDAKKSYKERPEGNFTKNDEGRYKTKEQRRTNIRRDDGNRPPVRNKQNDRSSRPQSNQADRPYHKPNGKPQSKNRPQ